MSDTLGRARMKMSRAINLSYEGQNPESRAEIRDAIQLLDAEMEADDE